MAYSTCPGQDRRFWKPDDIFDGCCPECGGVMEFWKDDVHVTCGSCGARVGNPRFDPGCARWCPYAEECLGDMARTTRGTPEAVRDRLESALRRLSGVDGEAASRAAAAARVAERAVQGGGKNALVVIAASLLHDLSPGEVDEVLEAVGLDTGTAADIRAALSGGDSPEANAVREAVRQASEGLATG